MSCKDCKSCKCKKSSCNKCKNCRCGNPNPTPQTPVADYIIIGLGTAGAPLARYLSEDMRTSVLAFESGPNFAADPNVLASPQSPGNPGPSSLTADPKYSKITPTDVSNINVGLRQIAAYSEGRMWGGSSGHNGLQAVRSSPDIYDDWAAYSGNSQWSYNNVLPFMRFLEDYVPNGCAFNPAQRGNDGVIGHTSSGVMPANAFYTAFAAQTNSNLLLAGDYNDPDSYVNNDGVVAPFQRFIHQNQPPVNGTWPQGTTASVRSWAQDFLDSTVVNPDGSPVAPRKLQIVSEATVVKIIIEDVPGEGLTATGIQYFLAGSANILRVARARKKVILCAGANTNPQLLQLSGIGPAALLEGLDIPVLVDNQHVGRNMQNHYGPNSALPTDAGHPFSGSNFDGGRCFQFGDGSSPGVPGLAPVVGTHDGVRRYQLFSSGNSVIGVNQLQQIYGTPNGLPAGTGITGQFSILGFLMRPNKLGTVEIVSRDPTVPPRVTAGYYKDGPTTAPYGPDLQQAINMFKVMANVSVAFTNRLPVFPPATHYPASEYPGPYADSRVGTATNDNFLAQDALNALLIAAYHNSGSCRMAATAADGVVDGNLDVFGVQGLAVADNSVTPEITTGNTTHPALVIGLVKAKIEGAIGLP